MRFSIEDQHFICDLVLTNFGIDYSYRWELLDTESFECSQKIGYKDLGSYRHSLRNAESRKKELRYLVSFVATTNTFFFSKLSTVQALVERIWRRVVGTHNVVWPVRIWSATCASREESHSLAIALAEDQTQTAEKVTILDSDLSPRGLAVDRGGRGQPSSMGYLTPKLIATYLQRTPEGMKPNHRILRNVKFMSKNLLDPEKIASLPPFDAIMPCHVLHYFERQTQMKIVQSLSSALAPGGYFTLGHTDWLQATPAVYELINKSTVTPSPPSREYPLRKDQFGLELRDDRILLHSHDNPGVSLSRNDRSNYVSSDGLHSFLPTRSYHRRTA